MSESVSPFSEWPNERGVLWTRLEPVTAAVLDERKPRIVCCPCTGLDHIDLAECQRRNIKVLSLRDTDVLPTITATAEHTIGLILALVRKIPSAVESVKCGEWERYRFMGRELSGMKLAVVGFGRIGQMVADRLYAFGVECLPVQDAHAQIAAVAGGDIVSIHTDLNEHTRGMCDLTFFAAMKPGSYFVNTSRGAVVDESALLAALRSWHLAGAALDVVCGEPDKINPELIAFANAEPERLIITPHIGGCCAESIEKAEVALARRLVQELEDEST